MTTVIFKKRRIDLLESHLVLLPGHSEVIHIEFVHVRHRLVVKERVYIWFMYDGNKAILADLNELSAARFRPEKTVAARVWKVIDRARVDKWVVRLQVNGEGMS